MSPHSVLCGLILMQAVELSKEAQQSSAPALEDEPARYLLRKALSAREAVRTGHVQITGYYRNEVPVEVGETGFEGPVKGLYVFDREANVYRYDGQWPCKTRISGPGEYSIALPDASTPTYTARFGYCRGRDYFADWSVVGPALSNINLRPLSDEKANRSGGCGCWPLDVMALGMFEQTLRNKGAQAAEVYGLMLEMPEVVILSGDEQQSKIRVGARGWSCTIDLEHAHSAPVRLNEVAPTTIGKPILFATNTEWREIGRVAVPIKYLARYTIPDGAVETLELELEWLSVNEGIPESEFEYTAFQGVPPRKLEVIDCRGEQLVHLGVWVADGGVLEPLSQLLQTTPAVTQQQPTSMHEPVIQPRQWRALIVLNAGIAILVVWLARSKRRQESNR